MYQTMYPSIYQKKCQSLSERIEGGEIHDYPPHVSLLVPLLLLGTGDLG